MQTLAKLTRIVALGANLLAADVVFAQQNTGHAVADADVVKSVLETNAKMTQAVDRMDFDAFFGNFVDTDKCVIIQNGTVFKTRQDAIQAVKRGYMGVSKVDRHFENPQVTVISPDAALLASEGTVTVTLADGRSMETRFAVSLVFVRRDGQWKVLHGHYSQPRNM